MNVVGEMMTPREAPGCLSLYVIVNENRKVIETVKKIFDAVEQGGVENAHHGKAKDKIRTGRVWVLYNVFIHLEGKVKVWAAGIDKPN